MSACLQISHIIENSCHRAGGDVTMVQKNNDTKSMTAEVLIGGKIFKLSGAEPLSQSRESLATGAFFGIFLKSLLSVSNTVSDCFPCISSLA